MRPVPALAIVALVSVAGCSAFGVTGTGPEPTRTLTPATVPTTEPTPTAASPTDEPAPVVLENARAREYVVTLSVVDGPVSAVEVVYADGRSAVVDPEADPSALEERLAAGSVVDVRVPRRAEMARYRVAANTTTARRPFRALGRAGVGTRVVWVATPAREGGVRANVAAAGVDACAPPHSLVTEFRVRVRLGADAITVDCA